MYCPSSFIISYRHPCAVLQLGHPRVHPFLGLATILVPLSVLPGPQCYLDFPLVNSVSLRFSFLTLCSILFLNSVLLQDLHSQPRWLRVPKRCLLSSWGHSRQTLHPLLDPYLGTNTDSPHQHFMRGIRCPLGFPHRTHSSRWRVGSYPQLRSFPCHGMTMLITICS